MLRRLSMSFFHSPGPSLIGDARRPWVCLAVALSLSVGIATSSEAGTDYVFAARPTPSPTPKVAHKKKPKITSKPYLVTIGPMDLDIQPVAGPRVRRPPLLPRPAASENGTEGSPKTPTPEEASKQPKPSEPSAFSPDAPPVLLPAEKPPATPAPVDKIEAPKESVLVPGNHGELDLKDAVIYFETPAGPKGSRIIVPGVIPTNPPTPGTLPESSATYRKDQQ